MVSLQVTRGRGLCLPCRKQKAGVGIADNNSTNELYYTRSRVSMLRVTGRYFFVNAFDRGAASIARDSPNLVGEAKREREREREREATNRSPRENGAGYR